MVDTHHAIHNDAYNINNIVNNKYIIRELICFQRGVIFREILEHRVDLIPSFPSDDYRILTLYFDRRRSEIDSLILDHIRLLSKEKLSEIHIYGINPYTTQKVPRKSISRE